MSDAPSQGGSLTPSERILRGRDRAIKAVNDLDDGAAMQSLQYAVASYVVQLMHTRGKSAEDIVAFFAHMVTRTLQDGGDTIVPVKAI